MGFFRIFQSFFVFLSLSTSVMADVMNHTSGAGDQFEFDGAVIRDISNQREYLSPLYFFNGTQFVSPGTRDIEYNGSTYSLANVDNFQELTNTFLTLNETNVGFENEGYFNTASLRNYSPEVDLLARWLGGEETGAYVTGSTRLPDNPALPASTNIWLYLENNYSPNANAIAKGRIHSFQFMNPDGSFRDPNAPFLVGVDYALTDDFYPSLTETGYQGVLFTRDVSDVAAPCLFLALMMFSFTWRERETVLHT